MSIREDELIEDLQAELAEYKQRAEAAEANLRELEMQEPVAFMHMLETQDSGARMVADLCYGSAFDEIMKAHLDAIPLYAKPFPAPKQEEK